MFLLRFIPPSQPSPTMAAPVRQGTMTIGTTKPSLPEPPSPEPTHANQHKSPITLIDPIKLASSAQIFKALDSPTRLQIIHLLAQRDHFVYELVETLGSSQPLISQHLRILRKANIVEHHRSGRLITYRLRCPAALDIIELAATTCYSDRHHDQAPPAPILEDTQIP